MNASNEVLNLTATESRLQSNRFPVLHFLAFCLCLVGIPGTVLTICFHAEKIKHGTKATASFLTALAVYDLLSLLSILFQLYRWLSRFITDPVKSGYHMFCHYYVTNYLLRFSKHCSNVLLMIIAIERLYSVLKPHKVGLIFTRKVGRICIVTVTLVVPLLLLPRAFEYTCVASVDKENQVVSYSLVYSEIGKDRSSFKWVYIVIVLFLNCLPLLGVIISNITLVIIFLHRSYSKTSILPLTVYQKREMKLTKMIVIATFIFVVSVSPLGIFFQFQGISSTFVPGSVYKIIFPLATFLETINYSANTVIYYAGSERFRIFVKRFICKIKCKCSQVPPAPSNQAYNIEL